MQKFAKLIAVKGVNVRKGQEVVVNASLDQPEFVKWWLKNAIARAQAKSRWSGVINLLPNYIIVIALSKLFPLWKIGK